MPDVFEISARAVDGEVMAVGGTEVSRATVDVGASSQGEIIYAIPADWVRQLPVVDVEVLVTAHEQGEDRPIATYRLVHEGALHR